MGYGLGCVRGEAVRGSAGSEGGIMWPCGPGAHVFFFFWGGQEQITAETARRNHPTKDKRQKTKDKSNKGWCSNQRTQR